MEKLDPNGMERSPEGSGSNTLARQRTEAIADTRADAHDLLDDAWLDFEDEDAANAEKYADDIRKKEDETAEMAALDATVLDESTEDAEEELPDPNEEGITLQQKLDRQQAILRTYSEGEEPEELKTAILETRMALFWQQKARPTLEPVQPTKRTGMSDAEFESSKAARREAKKPKTGSR